MAERKFTRGLNKPGMAAQLRETVSQVVRETTVQNKPQLAEPIDYEAILAKHRIIFNNDPHRELLLFPPEDVVQEKIKRDCRTVRSTVPDEVLTSQNSNNYFTVKCAQSYTSDWSVVIYKHSQYGSSYEALPKQESFVKLVDPKHEIDVEGDVDDELFIPDIPATLEGYLLKGPEGASEKMFANIATKSFKRRFCKLRQDATGLYYFDVCKEDKRQEVTQSFCLDECEEVIANKRKNKLGFQLRLTNQRSYVFAATTELELNSWLEKLCMAVHSSKTSSTDEKRPLPSVVKEERVSPNFGTLRSLEASLNPQLTKYAHETETSICLARKENRNSLFKLCTFQPSAELSNNTWAINHSIPEPLKEKFGERFLVKCESLNFRLQAPIDGEKGPLGQAEPYLTSLAFYDLKLNKKITEDFFFDVNQPHMKAVIQSIQENSNDDSGSLPDIPPNWLAFPKQAIFDLRNCHTEIFIVIRIETILQGSHVACTEPYIKPNPDAKLGLKTQRSARVYSSKLGKYRMPFAWAARPLFRPTGELDTSPEFPTIYRQESNRYTEEDILKILSDYRKPEKLSRLTTIPGVLRIHIDHYSGSLSNSVSSSLVPIIPFPIPPTQEPILEISEFPSLRVEDAYPFTDFVHHLYIYPKSLKYDSQKTFHRARNIACVIEIRDSDDKDAIPLKRIYGHHGELRKTAGYVCSVSHHVTTPTWMDEIKICLPTPLTSKHHVLFTFVHVSCDLGRQKKSEGKESALPEIVVGYSWLPLLHKGRLRVEPQNLPVSAHLPSGYLSFEPLGLGKGYAGPDIRWVDGQKPLFLVNLELVSTVTACDQHLHNFFIHMARLNDTRSLASLFPAIVESESHKPTEDAPKSPILQDGSRELSKLVKALHAVDVTVVINHLPVILNQLCWLLVRVNNEEVSVNVLKVLVHIVNEVHEINKAAILDSYLHYVFATPTFPDVINKATFHEEMVRTLCVLLRPSNTDFLVMHKFLRHARFFLLLIARSMAQSIIQSGRIKMQRQERFHSEYQKNIENLIAIMSPHIQQKYKDLALETRHANLAVAEFIKKCLSLMDRGFGFQLVNIYLNTFRPDDPRALFEYKFQFLESICQHEHFIPLNFPRAPNWLALRKNCRELDAEFRLCETFCRSHYLSGLLLQEVRAALNEVADVRRIAIKTLKDLLAKHELDDRYQKKGHQSRISTLYLPWIFVVLDNWNRLALLSDNSLPYQSSTNASSTMSCIASPSLKPGQSLSLPRNTEAPSLSPSNSWKRNTYSAHSEISSPFRSDFNPNRNSSYLAIIAGQGNIGSSQGTLTNGSSFGSLGDSDSSSTLSFEAPTLFEGKGEQDGTELYESNSQEFNLSEKERGKEKMKTHSRNPSKDIPSAPILRYDKLQPDEVKDVLFCLLYIVKHAEDDALIAWWHNAIQHDLICFFHILELCLKQFKYLGKKRVQFCEGDQRKSSTLPPRITPPNFGSKPPIAELRSSQDNESVFRSLVEANLANEVGLIVLDSVGLFCMNFKKVLLGEDGDNPLMRKVLDIYLSFLQVGQSESLSKHVFAALRAFINNFPVALYQGNAWLCGRLCCELLRCCASKLAVVRQEACAVLYLLMRSNFEYSGQKALTRVHLQVIVSLSQLLGEIGGLNSARFGESLSVINNFANSDKAMLSTVFPGEVRDLTKRAQTVLKATLQMRQQAQDPELLIDLQHSLANSYSATPELRKTWLETMAHHHSRLGNWSEVALCHVHVAALIAEYLFRRNLRSKGCEQFSCISPNIVHDESNLRLDSGIQDTNYDESVFMEQLEESIKAIEKAERYEMLQDLYQLILPIHKQRRDFLSLAACYTRLAQACTRAEEANRTGRRLLGTFYRVALYGEARFGEEAGTEYIYKEPKVTSLPEIAERLNKLYTTKFGPERVKIAMDSNPIESEKLDLHMAVVQITHLIPHFDNDELLERQTDFERNHNINKFMYEVPFTTDGRIRGSPEEQCKRRIILTSQYYFPYVKKRLRVISRETVDLSPIEVAVDEMRIRVKEIAEVVQNQPTDLKKLQLRLQGSISVQVNAGPLAYASAFLGLKAKNYPQEQVVLLQELYRDFVHICGAALELNGKLILSDQREYHEVLKLSFRDLVTSLANILEDPSFVGEWEGSVDSSMLGKRSSVLVFTATSGNGSSQA